MKNLQHSGSPLCIQEASAEEREERGPQELVRKIRGLLAGSGRTMYHSRTYELIVPLNDDLYETVDNKYNYNLCLSFDRWVAERTNNECGSVRSIWCEQYLDVLRCKKAPCGQVPEDLARSGTKPPNDGNRSRSLLGACISNVPELPEKTSRRQRSGGTSAALIENNQAEKRRLNAGFRT
jgi:hypothetical protein